ncbi:hypothetical protein DSO57_1029051 [Entomophthora muscae]|uniref:Uncharacterized protein n=1 Tax=Entomophthora muscae TaxID=34485 RepID=A0ACC2T183_9FUNG|nr:hypothetical protein DSO57_1029051 [Entomophthora muscae]
MFYTAKGFSIIPGPKHVYWVKPGRSSESPLVFSAGFGIGAGGYVLFINKLIRQFPDRTVVIFETPYANFRPTAPVATEAEGLREIDDMFLSLGLGQCTWIGHSFGTNTASWVVKHRPHYINKLILVDPVCFRTWDASLYRSLFYRPSDSVESRMFQLFLAQEPNIACAVTRQLNWYENTLFPEQMAMPTEIFFSSFDTLVDLKGCQDYLQHRIAKDNLPHIHLNMLPIARASFQFSPRSIVKIINAIQ